VSKGFFTRAMAVALAVLTVVSVSACGNSAEKENVAAEATVLKVKTAKPVVDYIDQTSSFTGKVMPDDSVSVYGKSSGTVLKTYFEIGDTVEEGQLLFELDPKDYQIALEQSKLAYEAALNNIDKAESGSGDALAELQYQSNITTAQNAYEKVRNQMELTVGDDFDMSAFKKARNKYRAASKEYDLNPSDETFEALKKAEDDYYSVVDDYANFESFSISLESAYDAYMTAVESYEIYKSMQKSENTASFDISRQQAKLQYDSMLQTMDNLKVYAPISGVIDSKNVSANDTYAPSMAGYVVSNKDIMTVTFAVSGDVVSEMSIGDKVIVENGNKKYNAEISEIGTMVNAASGLFTVKARLTEDANILSGVTVKLTAITAKSEDAVVIPVSTVYYDNGAAYVYVAKDGMAVATPVTVGIISGDTAEIIEGLSESDSVITSWSAKLDDGVAVEVSEEV